MTFDLTESRRKCEAAQSSPGSEYLVYSLTRNQWALYIHARTALPAACDVIEAAAAREAELTSKYKRLRAAINGSVPRDLEYMASLEKEVERLRAENAELRKRPAGLSDAAIGAACAFETARRMDEAEAAEAAGGTQ